MRALFEMRCAAFRTAITKECSLKASHKCSVGADVHHTATFPIFFYLCCQLIACLLQQTKQSDLKGTEAVIATLNGFITTEFPS